MIVIEIDGVKGNVTLEGFDGFMEVSNLQFGMGRSISMEVGQMANRERQRPSFSEVTFNHVMDASTTSLFKLACVGREGINATIIFLETSADQLSEYLEYKLTDVLISGYSITADGDGAPVETISLSFATIEMEYLDSDSANAAGNPALAGYDLAKAKRI